MTILYNVPLHTDPVSACMWLCTALRVYVKKRVTWKKPGQGSTEILDPYMYSILDIFCIYTALIKIIGKGNWSPVSAWIIYGTLITLPDD